jgi:hypothetical protein
MSKVKCGLSEVDAHDGKMQQGPSTKLRAEASTRYERAAGRCSATGAQGRSAVVTRVRGAGGSQLSGTDVCARTTGGRLI